MDLVYRVVQIGQAVAGEEIRGQRVEYVSGFVEGAMDESPDPPRVYTLVSRVDRDKPAGMSGHTHRRRVIDEL